MTLEHRRRSLADREALCVGRVDLVRLEADPTRASILLLLMLGGSAYPPHVADQLGLTRHKVSNHLAHLRRSGLVVAHAEGRRTRYELADDATAAALADLLEAMLATGGRRAR